VSAQREGRVEAAEANRPLWTRPWFVFLVALGLRLAVVPFLVGDRLDPARDHWRFGWETGRIARSLASGHGFGSPFFGWTGPTAWMGPIYPAMVAGVFKIFGIYTAASAWIILMPTSANLARWYVSSNAPRESRWIKRRSS
jgi:hypothetical protein